MKKVKFELDKVLPETGYYCTCCKHTEIDHSGTYVLASEANERIKVLEDALKKIAYPIKYLQSNLKEGEQLNGVMALELADNSSWLKETAREVLEVKHG